MSSNLKVNNILPSTGTNIGLGTASGTLNVDSGCKVQVGTALTLGHTQGVQFHTQNLHSEGFEVNQVNASGIITASSFSGSGANLTSIPAGNLTGTVADARISTLTASKLTGALPAISGANLTGIAGIPTGVIVLWSGAANAIPSGYVLCDGNNSTPDLRDRFVVGAGNNYSVNDTGGANTVTLSINEIPSHTHTYTWQIQGNGPNASKATRAQRRTQAGDQSGNTGSAGGGQAHENRPPYYALCYIMKT